VSRGAAKSCRLKKILEFLGKNSLNLLTNGTRCAIMSMSRGEHIEILPYGLVETETLRIDTNTTQPVDPWELK
jgi:hypothetical protein